MQEYYARRAAEYESIYAKPERQPDLRRLELFVSEVFAGLDVLELACGTGYWTQFVARSAKQIVATDINQEVINIAELKDYKIQPQFCRADAYRPDAIAGEFNAVFAAFWWSHVPLELLPQFLDKIHARVPHGSKIAFLDNRYIEGSSTPISFTDALGNSYQDRTLADGSQHRVLKNFPNRESIQTFLTATARNMVIHELDYYWTVVYST